MAKKSRRVRDTGTTEGTPAEGAVGPRQPCPCGSGKRYKACHGAGDGAPAAYVARPFEGLPSECDVIALRELVPAATAPLTVKGTKKNVLLASLLPMAAPAMVRDSGDVWLGLQVQHNYGDPSRDLGAVLSRGARGRARHRGPDRPARRRAPPPGPGRGRQPRHHRPRRLRLLGRRRRGRRLVRLRAGGRQRRGLADRRG